MPALATVFYRAAMEVYDRELAKKTRALRRTWKPKPPSGYFPAGGGLW